MALLVDVCEEWEKGQKLLTKLKTFKDIIKTGGADFRLNKVLIIVKQRRTAEEITELIRSESWSVVFVKDAIDCLTLSFANSNKLCEMTESLRESLFGDDRIRTYLENESYIRSSEMKDATIAVILASETQYLGKNWENITLVVNYDYPNNILDYCERIEKFHKSAAILTLFTKEDSRNVKDLIKVLLEKNQEVPGKLQNLQTEYYKDIDSLVEFIEGKSLGAVPKRKLKEKVAVSKKLKNKSNKKCKEKENIAIPKKTGQVLIPSNAIRIDKDTEIRQTETSQMLAPIKILETRNIDLPERALETEDIDLQVDFIERKPLGAVPKRKSNEKVPQSTKKIRNKSNKKHEEKTKVLTPNILTPQKTEKHLIPRTAFEQSYAHNIEEDTYMRLAKAPNNSNLGKLSQEVLQTTEVSSNNRELKSLYNETHMSKKIQAQKMELQQQQQQLEEKRTNINKREDDLVVKHSKEIAIVLNSKTEAEDDMQAKCKKLNVINSEMVSTETKLNDLKKQIITLEETRAALKFQMEPIEKEIELDVKKINKLKRKQNYLEGLCGTNIDKIKKEKELVALQMISLQNEIRSNIVDIEKFKNSGFKQEPDITPKYKNLQCSTNLNQVSDIPLKKPNPNKEMVIFLKTIIKEKERSLECPVCFETAKIPIYMCSESHLICFTCKLKMNDCPVCRKKYPEELIRNRYAEEDADKLADLYLRMEDMMQMNTD